MASDRESAMLEGIRDLLDSKTWKPSEDDLSFAIGYVASYVRQVTGVATTEGERSYIKTLIMVVCR